MLNRVKTIDTVDAIVEQILRLIRDGTLAPGDRLPTEGELMEQLNVGRSSVREAKRVLAARGVIDSQPGRGTFVSQLESGMLDDLLDSVLLQALLAKETLVELQEVRDLLESQVVLLAVKHATDEDLQAMEDCLRQAEESDDPDVPRLTIDFHRAVAAATHNSVLMQLYDVISGMLLEYQRPLYERYADLDAEIRDHRAIYEAVRQHDVERAQTIMREHMSGVRVFLDRFVDQPS